MSNPTEDDDASLYRCEYYEPEDQCSYIDWVWLKEDEISGYLASYMDVNIRPATQEEADLYEEAYADGYGIAAVLEFESKDDGVTFRVEVGEDGNLKQGHKMFKCAICEKHKEFDTEVGTAGGFYLTELRGENLWHICYECAMISVELDQIDDDPKD